MIVRIRPARSKLLGLIALTATIATVGLIASSSSAQPHRPLAHRMTAARPTIVLVHGAWADASSWDGVITRLQSDGYTVVAPANALRSLSGDAVYLASVLRSIKGPIVLVGHSYGGAVITKAATRDPQVKALVYLDAFAPAQGESVLQLASEYPGSELPTAITEVPYSDGGSQTGVDVYLRTSSFRSAFAADVPSRMAAEMAVTQRPIALAALMEKSGAPAWRTIPSWYLVGLDDNAIPPAAQEFMAKRAHAHVTMINSSHDSPVSHPAAVTAIILTAVRSVSHEH